MKRAVSGKTLRPKIVIILGATGTGKTDLSLKLAPRLGAEIISADSMQVYRFMDIGTAKPSPEERARVRHHLIDIADPDEQFNASRFAAEAGGVIRRLSAAGRTVLVVGGTGLYIRALTGGLIEGPGPDREFRRRLREDLKKSGAARLHARLRELDAAAAGRIGVNDAVRIIRALEVCERGGEPISKKQETHGFRQRPYDFLKIGLQLPRQELYERINRRCEDMIRRGIVDEVRALIDRGYEKKAGALHSLGYRHIMGCIRGDLSQEEALRLMQRNTRNFAKRQITWFGADEGIEWFSPQAEDSILARIRGFLGD
ncbi:MAG TPA: tRNA (adenosine(37)-N6)-dimethylallyltransferase MiaA [Syntrophales bacterium]|nr:tRNA (adenosine(37)-N6)-dimethylallyltransferase MiaA [Syntrophales bacterium]HOX94996.1 tRNA (adenosine(37)-N6)-dimethylallyltransferase MiaA [Syntrophales bacterium]HPI57189.1 tRNA (adenosine(37)-N6)-dimethylallyltransferase MiaA [Syntrophales bacterium]HPN23427.1 tRNA (adenosine(37)-N6)-dimethylallyltransferase MiaA [Syntrophales bacterium]HQM28048.1 tRNA (adenosine(37)-N6)-dimethylallyltransferase MiaA [Syntrophales bacterium]